MVLRRHLKTIHSKENSFEVQRHRKTEKHLKKGRKTAEFMQEWLPHAPRAWTWAGSVVLLFSKQFWLEKHYFHSL